jgi:putative transposase
MILNRDSRSLPYRFTGRMLCARISTSACWWFVCITGEMPDEVTVNPHPPLGIDVGLNRLATSSAGRKFANQKPFVHQCKKMRRLNKALARRTKGGKNWLKTKEKLGRVHDEIACMRLDWLHKLTTQLARDQWYGGGR